MMEIQLRQFLRNGPKFVKLSVFFPITCFRRTVREKKKDKETRFVFLAILFGCSYSAPPSERLEQAN